MSKVGRTIQENNDDPDFDRFSALAAIDSVGISPDPLRVWLCCKHCVNWSTEMYPCGADSNNHTIPCGEGCDDD